MKIADVSQIAALHAEIFPDYFLTRLGPGVLEILYTELASNPRTWSFVSTDGPRINGFVAGVAEWDRIKREIAHKYWSRAIAALAPQLIRAPSLIAPLARRIVPAPQKFFRQDAKLQFEFPCYLLSIGIAPDVRGTDAAARLTQTLFETLERAGFVRVALYTRANNQRAQGFFEKMGFELAGTEGTGQDASLIYVRGLESAVGISADATNVLA